MWERMGTREPTIGDGTEAIGEWWAGWRRLPLIPHQCLLARVWRITRMLQSTANASPIAPQTVHETSKSWTLLLTVQQRYDFMSA